MVSANIKNNMSRKSQEHAPKTPPCIVCYTVSNHKIFLNSCVTEMCYHPVYLSLSNITAETLPLDFYVLKKKKLVVYETKACMRQ